MTLTTRKFKLLELGLGLGLGSGRVTLSLVYRSALLVQWPRLYWKLNRLSMIRSITALTVKIGRDNV
jgi:hypothetical protein